MIEVFGKELRRISGDGGSTYIYPTEGSWYGGWHAIHFLEDSEVFAINDHLGNDLLDSVNLYTNITVKAGALITFPVGVIVGEITLSTGSAVAYCI